MFELPMFCLDLISVYSIMKGFTGVEVFNEIIYPCQIVVS